MSIEQVKETALEYSNCASLPRVTRLIKEIRHQREALEAVRLTVEKQCSIFGGGRLCRPFNSSFITNTIGVKEEAEEACWSSSQLPRPARRSRIQGLGCSSNQSLNFYVMDADQYQHFAIQLGYSKNQFQLNPNVIFIVDSKVFLHHHICSCYKWNQCAMIIIEARFWRSFSGSGMFFFLGGGFLSTFFKSLICKESFLGLLTCFKIIELRQFFFSEESRVDF